MLEFVLFVSWEGWTRWAARLADGDNWTIFGTLFVAGLPLVIYAVIKQAVDDEARKQREKEMLELARRQEQRERERDGAPDG